MKNHIMCLYIVWEQFCITCCDNTILSNSKLLYSLYSLTSELAILVFYLGLYSSPTNLNFKTPHFEAKTRIKTLSQAKIYLMQASQMNKMIRLYLIYFKF